MQADLLKSLFKIHKESSLSGRYIHAASILDLLKNSKLKSYVNSIGKSVDNETIFSITLGTGSKKILMWSQMHGNESTTTKAIFDMINVIISTESVSKSILENCTLKIIPILNPDGAKAYTRLNANNIDLNRDAQDLSQPESKVLKQVFDSFKPNYCFNLHGQRTIFSVGDSNYPATVSFLAPAQDEKCTITDSRKIAMEIISVMNTHLQQHIPNQIGIYDDAFNLNCVGDTFQSLNVPTVLFEAGHFANDYNREKTRELMFHSLLIAIHFISGNNITGNKYDTYLKIPENQKLFYDIIIRNTSGSDIGIQYVERLIGKSIHFIPKIEKISDLSSYFAHREINARGHKVLTPNGTPISEGNENDFVSINNENFSLKLKKI
ncbi:M14 family metallopeptidase [Psychroserpens ponticola]|uniref:M14 family metallopeptidase n=1 Tax=Psychroserpens ponticola TaxID=2932268 RepID=A0ABY7S2A5_9FLAO|nr:M14 metallopeptidase family protein [Psychroserpens ponticola]WCO03268.1 M14 family metallopeptidase [Psychroserpens ponticola]